DQLEAGRAQGRGQVGDAAADPLAVPLDEFAGVGGEDADRAGVQPVRVGDVLLDVGDAVVEQGAVHVEDQEVPVEVTDLAPPGFRQVGGRCQLRGGGDLVADGHRARAGRGGDRGRVL